jgi:hypothetical protein
MQAADRVWNSTYEGKRLLSDATWLWCRDNREAVREVGTSLGLGQVVSDPIWELEVTPTAFYRACTVAADAVGNRVLKEPGMDVVAVAREVGYTHPEGQILQGALEACAHFDANGVNSLSVDVAIHNVAVSLGHTGDDELSAEIIVGAASAALCPEYADAVASFG